MPALFGEGSADTISRVTSDDWLLDLGRVCDAARVKVNGHDAGAVWCAPWQIAVGKFLQPGKNVLEIEVTNLGLNRVRDLDIRKVNWKYFYDANVNSKTGGGKFDASRLPLRDSGLLGPVRLQPVKKMDMTPPPPRQQDRKNSVREARRVSNEKD